MRRALSPAEKLLKAAGQAELFLEWDGDGAAESVEDHAGIRDTLGRELARLVVEAEAEVVGELMPTSMGTPGRVSGVAADGAA